MPRAPIDCLRSRYVNRSLQIEALEARTLLASDLFLHSTPPDSKDSVFQREETNRDASSFILEHHSFGDANGTNNATLKTSPFSERSHDDAMERDAASPVSRLPELSSAPQKREVEGRRTTHCNSDFNGMCSGYNSPVGIYPVATNDGASLKEVVFGSDDLLDVSEGDEQSQYGSEYSAAIYADQDDRHPQIVDFEVSIVAVGVWNLSGRVIDNADPSGRSVIFSDDFGSASIADDDTFSITINMPIVDDVWVVANFTDEDGNRAAPVTDICDV